METFDGQGLFKGYCGLMTVLYLTLAGVSVVVPLALDANTEQLIQFLVIGLISFPLMLMFAYGLFLPRAKWAYPYGIVLICIGLTSCCFWPICIPLLIKWVKPEVKEWFEPVENVFD